MFRTHFCFFLFLLTLLSLSLPTLAQASPERCPSTQTATMPPLIAGAATTGRLTLDDKPAACGTAKPFPGANATAAVRYMLFPYTNRTSADACVSVTLTATAGELQTAAYLNSFLASNPGLNYLGDPGKTASALVGSTQTTQSYAFNVPAFGQFTIMVEETVHGAGGSFSLGVANCGQIVTRAIAPAFGPIAGGESLYVSGLGFLAGATVSLGGAPLTALIVHGEGIITGVTGAHAAGVVDVIVTNSDGTTSTLAGGYTYLAPVPSTLQVTSSVSPTVFGQSFFFSAQVAGTSPGGFDGMVTFYDGATAIGTGSVASNGYASLIAPALAVGSHSITATYDGGHYFQPSTSPPYTQVVNAAATTTTLVSSNNPAYAGSSFALTATVTAVSPASGMIDGTVTFTEGTTTLGTATVNTTGTASLPLSLLAAGTHEIVASYSGSTSFAASTATLTETIVQGTPNVSLVSSSPTSVYGQSVSFIATVAGSALPTGTVAFSVNGGATRYTTSLTGGQATWSVVLPPAQTGQTVTATYSGDLANLPGAATVTQVVSRAQTQILLASSSNPAGRGTDVTITATITPLTTTPTSPTGNVVFTDGTTGVSGTVPLTGTSASYVLIHASDPFVPGSHSIFAEYQGNVEFGSSATTLAQTEIEDDGGTPPQDDGGLDASTDADAAPSPRLDGSIPSPVHDAGVPPARDDGGYRSPPADDGSAGSSDACGCRVAGAPASAPMGALGLGLVAAVLARRRARRGAGGSARRS